MSIKIGLAECPALKNVRSKKGGSGGRSPPDVDTILLFLSPPLSKKRSRATGECLQLHLVPLIGMLFH